MQLVSLKTGFGQICHRDSQSLLISGGKNCNFMRFFFDADIAIASTKLASFFDCNQQCVFNGYTPKAWCSKVLAPQMGRTERQNPEIGGCVSSSVVAGFQFQVAHPTLLFEKVQAAAAPSGGAGTFAGTPE